MAKSVVRRGCGEIGKHARFRAWWAQALEGSSPFSRIPPHLSRPPFHAGAGLSAHLHVPVADVRIAIFGLAARIYPHPVAPGSVRRTGFGAVDADGGSLLDKA